MYFLFWYYDNFDIIVNSYFFIIIKYMLCMIYIDGRYILLLNNNDYVDF